MYFKLLTIIFIYRVHINHVLREFKAHMSWFKTSESKSLPISIRYFYIPWTLYGQSKTDCVSSNIISGSTDPLQLEQKQDDCVTNNCIFNEWQIPNSDSDIICPPSAACVLIIVTVTSKKKKKHISKQHQNEKRDSHSESDTDNGNIVPEDEENTNSEEGN